MQWPLQLCQAFGITRSLNGADMCGEDLYFTTGNDPGEVVCGQADRHRLCRPGPGMAVAIPGQGRSLRQQEALAMPAGQHDDGDQSQQGDGRYGDGGGGRGQVGAGGGMVHGYVERGLGRIAGVVPDPQYDVVRAVGGVGRVIFWTFMR